MTADALIAVHADGRIRQNRLICTLPSVSIHTHFQPGRQLRRLGSTVVASPRRPCNRKEIRRRLLSGHARGRTVVHRADAWSLARRPPPQGRAAGGIIQSRKRRHGFRGLRIRANRTRHGERRLHRTHGWWRRRLLALCVCIDAGDGMLPDAKRAASSRTATAGRRLPNDRRHFFRRQLDRIRGGMQAAHQGGLLRAILFGLAPQGEKGNSHFRL